MGKYQVISGKNIPELEIIRYTLLRKKSKLFMKSGKYAQAGRFFQLVSVDDGQVLKFRGLTYGAASSHRHACRFTIRNYSEALVPIPLFL
jgi:hypothetical protein